MSPTGQIFEIEPKLKDLLYARNDWKQFKVQKILRDASKNANDAEEGVDQTFKTDQKEESTAVTKQKKLVKETILVLTTIDAFKQLKKEKTVLNLPKKLNQSGENKLTNKVG